MLCTKEHRYDRDFAALPEDQGNDGRHHCAGCAYDRGFDDGLNMRTILDLRLDTLDESQAGAVRHRSPQAAYALGYLAGVYTHYGA